MALVVPRAVLALAVLLVPWFAVDARATLFRAREVRVDVVHVHH